MPFAHHVTHSTLSTPGTPGDDGGAVDGTERLSADDMATAREGQFLAAALAHQAQVARAARHRPGTCANCNAQCLPLAVFCDPDCRADYEDRQRVLQRQGRTR